MIFLLHFSNAPSEGGFWQQTMSNASVTWTMLGVIATVLAVAAALIIPYLERRNRTRQAEVALGTLQSEAMAAMQKLDRSVELGFQFQQALASKATKPAPPFVVVLTKQPNVWLVQQNDFAEMKSSAEISLEEHVRHQALFFQMRPRVATSLVDAFARSQKLIRRLNALTSEWTAPADVTEKTVAKYVTLGVLTLRALNELQTAASSVTKKEIFRLQGDKFRVHRIDFGD